MSEQSALTDEMREYGEMLLWRWDNRNPDYERGDEPDTTKKGVAEATVRLFPTASNRQVAEMVGMSGHGPVSEEYIEEVRDCE